MQQSDRNKITSGTLDQFDEVLARSKGDLAQRYKKSLNGSITFIILQELVGQIHSAGMADPYIAYRIACFISETAINFEKINVTMQRNIERCYRKHSFTQRTLGIINFSHVHNALFVKDVKDMSSIALARRRNTVLCNLYPLKIKIYSIIFWFSRWSVDEARCVRFPVELACMIARFTLHETLVTDPLSSNNSGDKALQRVIAHELTKKKLNSPKITRKRKASVLESHHKAHQSPPVPDPELVVSKSPIPIMPRLLYQPGDGSFNVTLSRDNIWCRTIEKPSSDGLGEDRLNHAGKQNPVAGYGSILTPPLSDGSCSDSDGAHEFGPVGSFKRPGLSSSFWLSSEGGFPERGLMLSPSLHIPESSPVIRLEKIANSL